MLLNSRNANVFVFLPIVVVLIDFLSGFIHWLFDNRIKPGPTFFGRMAVDFLDHHVRPQRTVEVSFVVSASRPAMFVTLPLVSLACVIDGAVLSGLIFWTGALAMFIPQTHKCAHRDDCSLPLHLLQTSRIMLHPESHRQHHFDNARAYCVFTGWLNPMLDAGGFWRFMDRVFDRFQSA